MPEDSAVANDPDSSEGIPFRIPRASRIYTPRVGPPALPKKRELRDDSPVTFQAEHPKLLGSKVHAAYESTYRTATTVSEARALGASRPMVKYDVDKGYAVVHEQPAVVVLALAATFAPLVEAWCAEDSELGKVGELRGRRVIKFTQPAIRPTRAQASVLLTTSARGAAFTCVVAFCVCTPWTAWQRINLSNAKPETRERVLSDRQVSLEYVKTFGRLGKATLA